MPTLVVSNISCEHSEVPFIQYIQYLNIHHYPHHHHQHHHHDLGVGRAYVWSLVNRGCRSRLLYFPFFPFCGAWYMKPHARDCVYPAFEPFKNLSISPMKAAGNQINLKINLSPFLLTTNALSMGHMSAKGPSAGRPTPGFAFSVHLSVMLFYLHITHTHPTFLTYVWTHMLDADPSNALAQLESSVSIFRLKLF